MPTKHLTAEQHRLFHQTEIAKPECCWCRDLRDKSDELAWCYRKIAVLTKALGDATPAASEADALRQLRDYFREASRADKLWTQNERKAFAHAQEMVESFGPTPAPTASEAESGGSFSAEVHDAE